MYDKEFDNKYKPAERHKTKTMLTRTLNLSGELKAQDPTLTKYEALHIATCIIANEMAAPPQATITHNPESTLSLLREVEGKLMQCIEHAAVPDLSTVFMLHKTVAGCVEALEVEANVTRLVVYERGG